MTCPFTGGDCYYGAEDDDGGGYCSHTGGDCYYGAEDDNDAYLEV